jgi:DNA primase
MKTPQHISVSDVVSLLEYGGMQRIKVRDREVSFCCPLHDDNTPSASIHVDKKTFHCFSCNTGTTLYRFLKMFELHDILSGTRQYQIEINLGDKGSVIKPLPESLEDFEDSVLNTGTLARGLELFKQAGPLSQNKTCSEYMKKRLGESYKLPVEARYHGGNNSIVFKTDFNVVERKLSPDQKIRYSSFGKELNLFCGYQRIGGPLIIVEGVFDYITLHNFGFQNAAAMLTSRVTKKQLINLNQLLFSEVVFCPDNDKAGVKNVAQNTRDIRAAVNVPVSVMLIKGKKDVNDLTFDEFSTFYHSRQLISSLQQRRLEKVTFS